MKTSASKAGSALMVVLVVVTAMVAAVGSFVHLANQETRISNISFHANSGLNLAEGSLELALYAINKRDWSGWSLQNGVVVMTERKVDLENGMTGLMRAEIHNVTTNPRILAEGVVLLPNRPDVSRQIEVYLERRSLFANGLTARDRVVFSGGNASVDSYRSSLGPWNADTNRNDQGSVASVSVEVDAVTLSNAEIYGFVATGGAEPSVGPNGRVYGANTPPNVKVDPDRVARDYHSDFPAMTPPSNYHAYLSTISNSTTLGNPLAWSPTVYRVEAIDLVNNTLDIIGPVVLHVIGDTKIAGGSGQLRVGTFGRLTMYADRDISIGGGGVANSTNRPGRMIVYGTGDSQEFSLHGNGAWHAGVYAPNAEISLRGGGGSGEFSGAVVGRNIHVNGTYSFHYDEDLGNFGGQDPTYRLRSWRELLRADERVNLAAN